MLGFVLFLGEWPYLTFADQVHWAKYNSYMSLNSEIKAPAWTSACFHDS